jgi:hypothetical protein
MPPKYHESVPKAVEDLPRAGLPLSLRLGELHPISSSDCKRELSKYPSLAALDVVVDKDW